MTQTKAFCDALSFIAVISSEHDFFNPERSLQELERHYTTLCESVGQDVADHFRTVAILQLEAQHTIEEQAIRLGRHLHNFCWMKHDNLYPDNELIELESKLIDRLKEYWPEG